MSWKLANFARLDPALQQRNIAGAAHGAQGEVEVWDEFNDNWERLAFESERLLEKITGRGPEAVEEMKKYPKGEPVKRSFGRVSEPRVLSSSHTAAYEARCCITGLPVPELLNADPHHPVGTRYQESNEPAKRVMPECHS